MPSVVYRQAKLWWPIRPGAHEVCEDPGRILKAGASDWQPIRAALKRLLAGAKPGAAESHLELTLRTGRPGELAPQSVVTLLEKAVPALLATKQEQERLNRTDQLRLALRLGSWQDKRDERTSSRVPMSGPETSRGSAADTAGTRSIETTAAELLENLAEVQAPVVRQINSWLATLEGHVIPADSSTTEIDWIRHLVRRAGCQLFYEDVAVQIRLFLQPRARNYTIQLRSQGGDVRQSLYAATTLPRLKAEPFDLA